MKNLNLILFANWGLGNLVLNSLIKLKNINIKAVFTQYDRNTDDSYFNKVFSTAHDKAIRVINTHNKNSHNVTIEALQIVGYDRCLGLSISFNKIFKKEILEKIKIINLHPSWLPKFRGPSPVLWAIKNCEKEIGLTLHFVDEGIDTGDIIKQVKIPIMYELTYNDYIDFISQKAKKFVIEFFNNIELPIKCTKQTDKDPYYKRINLTKEQRLLTLKELKAIINDRI